MIGNLIGGIIDKMLSTQKHNEDEKPEGKKITIITIGRHHGQDSGSPIIDAIREKKNENETF